jgi:glutamate N-acetyltransferase / amino-acid N-acetyltransferase
MIRKLPAGFRAAGIQCGLKKNGDLDLALFTSDQPGAAAGVFTTNRVKAAPVIYDQAVLQAGGHFRAVVANAGNANACTGPRGESDTRLTAEWVAAGLGCGANEVLVLSTGVIGVHLPMEKIQGGVRQALSELDANQWESAARAIMTTDTRPKTAFAHSTAGYSLAGFAKGAGMIAPNLATMLAVILTDAEIPQDTLQRYLQEAAQVSFNRIVVDGDMSTNDSVLLLANGASGVSLQGSEGEVFKDLLNQVCRELAQAIVRDGEGATRLVSVQVHGAKDENDAQRVGRVIATSPLCKTAFYGADPNWGRFLCAAGYSGAEFQTEQLALWLADKPGKRILLVEGGMPVTFDESEAIRLMQLPEWELHLDLGQGQAEIELWTCDLTEAYIQINGHYRT